jgi:hypothetical protein
MTAQRATAAGLFTGLLCQTVYRLMFIDTATGFLECLPPLRYLYYLLMGLSVLLAAVSILRFKPPADPVSHGGVRSQLLVMAVGVTAMVLGCKMAAEAVLLLRDVQIPIATRISKTIGAPITLAGGAALAYAGYDYTSLHHRQKKAGFALLGAAMQTYQLLYRFPELLEVTTAPAQTIELLYLLCAAPFMLFWARTLSGEATLAQNRLTYLAAAPTAILGLSYLCAEMVARFLLGDVLAMSELPKLSCGLMLFVSLMALDFVLTSGRAEQPEH